MKIQENVGVAGYMWLVMFFSPNYLVSVNRCLSKLNNMGRAIAQAVSRRLPTAAAQVQTRV
jgi:hypothetical protein